MRFARRSLLTIAALGAVLAPTAAAQAATILSTEQAPTPVAAWHGMVMWSQLDAATGNYRLVESVDGGAPTPVAIPERAGGPFDIDLGTSRSGSAYAVYTRDGDVYSLSVASGIEAEITTLSSPTLAERDPTVQRGEIGPHPARRRLRSAADRQHDQRLEGQPDAGEEALDRERRARRQARRLRLGVRNQRAGAHPQHQHGP